jgi:hypothetical protein
MKTYIKSKSGPALGFRTPDFFRASKFGGKGNKPASKFNASQFKTQHKGGA